MTACSKILIAALLVPMTLNGAEPGNGDASAHVSRFLAFFQDGAFMNTSDLVEKARRQGLLSRPHLDQFAAVLASTNHPLAYDEAAEIICAAGEDAKHCTTALLSSAEAALPQRAGGGRNVTIYRTVVAVNWPLDEVMGQRILHSMMQSYRKGKDAALLVPIAELLLLREEYATALYFLYEYAIETSAGGCTDHDLQLWLQSLCLEGVGKLDESIQALTELSQSRLWGSWFQRHPISKMTLQLIPGKSIRQKRNVKKIISERILMLKQKQGVMVHGVSASPEPGLKHEVLR